MQFNFRLKDTEEDQRIAEHLQQQVNASQYIRELIRADMTNRSDSDRLLRWVREEILHSGELELENAELKKELARWQSGLKR